ncbi:MAG TPA: hypothetical protein VLJ68_01475 [Chitinophagaceae bacterium]|nr:hypothetical protein [Chitinophagaceae bacterium]
MVPEEKDKVYKFCTKYLSENHDVDLTKIMRDTTGRDIGDDEIANMIAMAEESGRYVVKRIDRGHYRMSKNTNFDLLKSTKQANDSANTANKWMPWLTGATVVASICAVVISLSTEKLSPTLQHIDTTLQSQKTELGNVRQTLQSVQDELHQIVDSLKKP